MTLLNLLLALMFFLILNVATASSNVGAGIILGSPTGLTAKTWKDNHVAYDAGLAFSVSDYILVYGDYLFHYPGSIKQGNVFISELIPYIGFGGVFVITNRDRANNDKFYGKKSGSFGAGIRVPLGLEWKPGKPPLGVFGEIVPGISVAPATDILIMGGIGIRYYF
jgi:hypothetical protein